MTAEEALTYAHLSNWDVRKSPLFTEEGLAVPNRFATIRNNPFEEGKVDVLGVVGSKYEPIQNEDHADLLNVLVDESGAHFETAGSLRNGTQTFITMKLPETMTIGGVDEVETYIAALNSHDGTKAFQFIVSPVRIVCANTQAMAEQKAKSRFSVRHTKNGAEGIITQARETLNLTYKFVEAFEKEAEKLIQKSMDEAEFYSIVENLYVMPNDPSELIRTRVEDNRSKLMELFMDSPTATQIRGTAWAGYQAVTEYLDHYVIRQGKDANTQADYRAMNVITGNYDDMKANAFRMLVNA